MGYEELWCPDLESNQGHKDFQSFTQTLNINNINVLYLYCVYLRV
jgi:hypothetical protein